MEAAIKEAAVTMGNALSHPLYRMEDIREDLGLRPNDPHLLGLRINLMPFRSDSHGGLHWTTHNLSIGPIEDLSLSIYDRAEDGRLRIDFDGNSIATIRRSCRTLRDVSKHCCNGSRWRPRRQRFRTRRFWMPATVGK